MKANITLFRSILSLCSDYSVAQTYTIADLGKIGGNLSAAFGINHAEQVVGMSYVNKQTGLTHAFLWSAATGLQDFGTLPGGK